jgi:hypothetical protein
MLRIGVAFPRPLEALRCHCFGLLPTFWDPFLSTRGAVHLVEYFVAPLRLSGGFIGWFITDGWLSTLYFCHDFVRFALYRLAGPRQSEDWKCHPSKIGWVEVQMPTLVDSPSVC